MVGFIGNIGPWELIFILAIALIVVGPGKLPEVAKSLGKATKDFKKAASGIKQEFQETISLDEEPVRVNIKKTTVDEPGVVQSDKKTDSDKDKEDL